MTEMKGEFVLLTDAGKKFLTDDGAVKAFCMQLRHPYEVVHDYENGDILIGVGIQSLLLRKDHYVLVTPIDAKVTFIAMKRI